MVITPCTTRGTRAPTEACLRVNTFMLWEGVLTDTYGGTRVVSSQRAEDDPFVQVYWTVDGSQTKTPTDKLVPVSVSHGFCPCHGPSADWQQV